MAKTAWIFSYKLKKNVSKEQFIELTQKLYDEVISKAKGKEITENFYACIQMNTGRAFISQLVKNMSDIMIGGIRAYANHDFYRGNNILYKTFALPVYKIWI